MVFAPGSSLWRQGGHEYEFWFVPPGYATDHLLGDGLLLSSYGTSTTSPELLGLLDVEEDVEQGRGVGAATQHEPNGGQTILVFRFEPLDGDEERTARRLPVVLLLLARVAVAAGGHVVEEHPLHDRVHVRRQCLRAVLRVELDRLRVVHDQRDLTFAVGAVAFQNDFAGQDFAEDLVEPESLVGARPQREDLVQRTQGPLVVSRLQELPNDLRFPHHVELLEELLPVVADGLLEDSQHALEMKHLLGDGGTLRLCLCFSLGPLLCDPPTGILRLGLLFGVDLGQEPLDAGFRSIDDEVVTDAEEILSATETLTSEGVGEEELPLTVASQPHGQRPDARVDVLLQGVRRHAVRVHLDGEVVADQVPHTEMLLHADGVLDEDAAAPRCQCFGVRHAAAENLLEGDVPFQHDTLRSDCPAVFQAGVGDTHLLGGLAEQVEHRLDGMLGGQLAFHESYRDQVAAAAFAVRVVQIASGGRVAPQARRRLLFDNKIRWILLDPSAYRGNVCAEVSDYSARHKGVTLVGQRGH